MVTIVVGESANTQLQDNRLSQKQKYLILYEFLIHKENFVIVNLSCVAIIIIFFLHKVLKIYSFIL